MAKAEIIYEAPRTRPIEKVVLELSEAEAKHLKSVIGRVKYSALTRAAESEELHTRIWSALSKVPLEGSGSALVNDY